MGDPARVSMYVHISPYFDFLVAALEGTANSWDDVGGFKKPRSIIHF